MVTHFAIIAFSFNKLFDYMEILEQNIRLCSNLSSTATGEQEAPAYQYNWRTKEASRHIKGKKICRSGFEEKNLL